MLYIANKNFSISLFIAMNHSYMIVVTKIIQINSFNAISIICLKGEDSSFHGNQFKITPSALQIANVIITFRNLEFTVILYLNAAFLQFF